MFRRPAPNLSARFSEVSPSVLGSADTRSEVPFDHPEVIVQHAVYRREADLSLTEAVIYGTGHNIALRGSCAMRSGSDVGKCRVDDAPGNEFEIRARTSSRSPFAVESDFESEPKTLRDEMV